MIIKNFKKKIITTGLGLIVIGFIISIIGFGMSGFDTKIFNLNGERKWYQTITIE
ncbi:hypothetical protein [uncultured Clostridium sp.]|jgi:hypothetical protein|uniref:hypothetical protein n=1 Tax=uncultured Clostridium sp. TaxID=59620 RepID=UPI002620F25D|nr:hypothetical protein [uncultured Clostridium sp.]